MRLTQRDVRLVRDLALSHLLSRDQVIHLGYFDSVTRANTRLRELSKARFVRPLRTPFHAQTLYMAGPLAVEVVGERISPLLQSRAESPRFVQHAMATTEVRIALQAKGATWHFEQQLWREVNGHILKPDGLAVTSREPIFIECDMGHVSSLRMKERLALYKALASGDRCVHCYGFPSFRLLIATTGPRRAAHLRALVQPRMGFECLIQTFTDLGVAVIGSWS